MDEESRRERIAPGRSGVFPRGKAGSKGCAKTRRKPACSKEEPLPWSPKESLSPPGRMLPIKLGVGKQPWPSEG
jgi:hypothetical protein